MLDSAWHPPPPLPSPAPSPNPSGWSRSHFPARTVQLLNVHISRYCGLRPPRRSSILTVGLLLIFNASNCWPDGSILSRHGKLLSYRIDVLSDPNHHIILWSEMDNSRMAWAHCSPTNNTPLHLKMPLRLKKYTFGWLSQWHGLASSGCWIYCTLCLKLLIALLCSFKYS